MAPLAKTTSADGSSTSSSSSSTSSRAGPSTPTGTAQGAPTWKQHDFYAPRGIKPVRAMANLDLGGYFEGPRDIRQFSRVPLCLRLYGSVLPKLLIPMTMVGIWAAGITAVCDYVYDLGINPILLTVLGFIVGLSLSFRFSTAYERYNDGSKHWQALMLGSRVLSRTIWVFVRERHEVSAELGKADLLGKLAAINLLNAYAVSMKHRLRFEPAFQYVDLAPLVNHLDTMAGRADQSVLMPKPKTLCSRVAEYLGFHLYRKDPRYFFDKATENLGNMPLEILTHLTTYVKHVADEDIIDPRHIGTAMSCVTDLTEIQGCLERISNTPIPIAYSIAIAQITWVYILLLPLQLWNFLGWVTIPGTLFAAYIILSFERIGREIEDPFGFDVNDLPLDDYCRELAADLDVLTREPAPEVTGWMTSSANKVMYPLSMAGFDSWSERSLAEIREALRVKASTRSRTRMGPAAVVNESTPLLEEV